MILTYAGSSITLRDPDLNNEAQTESMYVDTILDTGKLKRYRDAKWDYRQKHNLEILVCEVEDESSTYNTLAEVVTFLSTSHGQKITVTGLEDEPKVCALIPDSFTREGRDSCGAHWLFAFRVEEVV